MKCTNCNAPLQADEIACESCGKSVIRTRDDLNKVDPKSMAIIGWALFAIGALAMIFVIGNMNLLSLSGLDFVVPVGLLVLGSGTVIYSRSLRK